MVCELLNAAFLKAEGKDGTLHLRAEGEMGPHILQQNEVAGCAGFPVKQALPWESV